MGLAVALAAIAALDAGAPMVERLKPSVVQIVDLSQSGQVASSGTGFIVTADGWVITNHHVIEHMSRPRARFWDKRSVEVVGILVDDDVQDLAVLQLEKGTYPPLTLGDSDALKVDQPVALLACPLGLGWTFSEGIVAAIRPEGLPPEMLNGEDGLPGDKLPLLQLNLPSAGGASGGPIVDEDGQVVGVVRAGFGMASDFLLAIPSKAVADRLAIAKNSHLGSVGAPRWRNLGISVAFFLGLIGWWMYRSRAR